jgi:hypothetical protein
MHCAKRSPCDCICGLTVPPFWDPAGASDRHARDADWNCGDSVVALLTVSPPSLVGSGKLVTPWARMHCA